MKTNRNTRLSRLLKEECGQTLMFVSVILVAFLGLSGLAVDAGHGFYAYELLKASTNAATLAGAAALPNETAAAANVNTFSSHAGDDNAYSVLQNVQAAVTTFSCLNTVKTTLNVTCENAIGGSGTVNALKVTQTAQVSTWVGQFFGVPIFNISATSAAAMKGGQVTPYHIAIIEDTTSSMNGTDSADNCSGTTQIGCALLGIQALLKNMDPCATGVTCSGSSSYVDDVSLYVFPAVTTPSDDDTCPTSNPPIVPYTFNNVTSGSADYTMASTVGTYQIINYSNDYKTSDGASSLNGSSALTIASGAGGCSGLKAPGGEGTYYAQVIDVAAANLYSLLQANAGTKAAMIILSDGDATACNTTTSTGNDCSGSNPSQIVATTGKLNGTGNATSNPPGTNAAGQPTGYKSPTFPSALGECGQAVQEAQAATKEGIIVYTIGYASEMTGCTTDATYSTAQSSTTYGAGAWAAGDSPCAALAAMASNASTFFSDDGHSCSALNAANAAYTSIPSIMTAVFNQFTSARLIPNGTT